MALTKSSCVVSETVNWLDECRLIFGIGADGDSAIKMAIRCLETGVGTTTRIPDSIASVPAILSEVGGHIIRDTIAREDWRALPFRTLRGIAGDRIVSRVKTLSGCGHLLSLPQVRQIVKQNLYKEVRRLLEFRPDGVGPFLEWVSEQEEDWQQLGDRRETWALAFAVDQPELGRRLAEWSETARYGRLFSWQEVEQFLRTVLRFCYIRLSFSSRWGKAEGVEQRETFLTEHFNLLYAFLDATEEYRHLQKYRETWPDVTTGFENRSFVLKVAYYWWQSEQRDVEQLGNALLSWCAEQDERAVETHEPPTESFRSGMYLDGDLSVYLQLLVELSGGKIQQFLALLRQEIPQESFHEEPDAGWKLLNRFHRIQSFLCSYLDTPERLGSVLGFLDRLALTARVDTRQNIGDALTRWKDPQKSHSFELPDWVSSQIAADIDHLTAYRELAAKGGALPNSLEEILERPGALEKEFEALKRQRDEGSLSESARPRLEKVKRWLDDIESVYTWCRTDLKKELDKRLPRVKFEALEKLVEDCIRNHWRTILGAEEVPVRDPDWNNALRLYEGLEKNKALLKTLLDHEVKGERRWMEQHGTNQAFLEAMEEQEVDTDCWLAPTQHEQLVGQEHWISYTETNPLKVLQMGNLFGTCLSVDGFNAFSTVANAVEVNKRVLYLKDNEGRIKGRKLIVLDPDGKLIGFNSYGSGREGAEASSWVKIIFELLSLKIAIESGVRLCSPEEDDDVDRNDLALFASWYYDTPEPFDWWTRKFAEENPGVKEFSEEEMCEWLFEQFEDDECLPGTPGERWATIRALIWLGEKSIGLPIMARLEQNEFDHIKRHTHSEQLRKYLDGNQADEGTEN